MKLPVQTSLLEPNPLIESELAKINGRANTHTASAKWVAYIASVGEEKLESLKVSKEHRIGSKVVATSGEKLPNSYKGKVYINKVVLVRGYNGWFLTEVEKISKWPNESPKFNLFIKQKAADIAKEKFLSQFSVMLEPTVEDLCDCIDAMTTPLPP